MNNFLKPIPLFVLLLTACGSAGGPGNGGPGNGGPGNGNPGNGGAGTVTGQALDAQGKPIAGAKVWVKPVVTTGLYETRTDANGRYEATGLPPVGYRVLAWAERQYNGQRYCIRLGHEKVEEYSPVNPAQGAVRNFVLKASGRIEDMDVSDEAIRYFGGTVSVMDSRHVPARNAPLEFTLTPVGPLLDGTQGKTLTLKPNANGYLLDVPVGVYRVQAVALEGGQRTPVKIGTTAENLSAEARLEFKSSGNCVGSYGSGIDGAYLYWSKASNTPPPPTGDTQTWDGTVQVDGGDTFYVRYVFTVEQGRDKPSESLYKGDFFQCAGPSTDCDKLGWAQGVRQGDTITLITMLTEVNASFATDGTFSGDTFSGTTNAVFQGKIATVNLARQ